MRRKAGAALPPPPSAPACPSWETAVARWRLQGTHRAPGTIRREEGLLRWLAPQLAGLPLNCISKGRIEDVKAAGLAAGWTPRSVNYALSVVRAILRAAVEWEWIPVVPRVKFLKLPRKRVRWISPGQALLLLGILPQHLADPAEFTLAVGLRKRAVMALEWSMVDFDADVLHVPGHLMKSGKPLSVPLNGRALRVLARREGIHPRYIFTYRGKPMREPAHARWRQGLRQAGIKNFRWHDLRHTWASWHVQSGTPLAVLKDLGGWETIEMVLIYAHLAQEQLSAAQARMDAWSSRPAAAASPA